MGIVAPRQPHSAAGEQGGKASRLTAATATRGGREYERRRAERPTTLLPTLPRRAPAPAAATCKGRDQRCRASPPSHPCGRAGRRGFPRRLTAECQPCRGEGGRKSQFTPPLPPCRGGGWEKAGLSSPARSLRARPSTSVIGSRCARAHSSFAERSCSRLARRRSSPARSSFSCRRSRSVSFCTSRAAPPAAPRPAQPPPPTEVFLGAGRFSRKVSELKPGRRPAGS